ncbi:MAG: hypothetical protein MI799_07945 [Desulfobacterales bacterium]|nr:hypothetical protein [Desulfobacterales bacterium]
MKSKIIILTFALSILLNLCLVVILFYQALNGCAKIADGRIGRLAEDTQIGFFGDSETLFTLPKGLVVRDASATGAGWFEPYRFQIVITSDNEALVDYSINERPPVKQDGEYYSADVTARRLTEGKP